MAWIDQSCIVASLHQDLCNIFISAFGLETDSSHISASRMLSFVRHEHDRYYVCKVSPVYQCWVGWHKISSWFSIVVFPEGHFVWKRWRVPACCEKSKFIISSTWFKSGSVCNNNILITPPDDGGMICHPDGMMHKSLDEIRYELPHPDDFRFKLRHSDCIGLHHK